MDRIYDFITDSIQIGLAFGIARYMTLFGLWFYTAVMTFYGRIRKAEGVDHTCAICLEEITFPAKLACCRHSFCLPCLVTWYTEQARIPSAFICSMCRGPSNKIVAITKDGEENWWEAKENEEKIDQLRSMNRIIGERNDRRTGKKPEYDKIFVREMLTLLFLAFGLPLFLAFSYRLVYHFVIPNDNVVIFKKITGANTTKEEDFETVLMFFTMLGIQSGAFAFVRNNLLISYEAEEVLFKMNLKAFM